MYIFPQPLCYEQEVTKGQFKEEQDMLGIAKELWTNSYVMFLYGLQYMNTPVLAD